MATEYVCTLCGEDIEGTVHRTKDGEFVCEECVEDVPLDELEGEDPEYFSDTDTDY